MSEKESARLRSAPYPEENWDNCVALGHKDNDFRLIKVLNKRWDQRPENWIAVICDVCRIYWILPR